MIRLVCVSVSLASALASFGQVHSDVAILTLDQPQMAGISGFRAMWDTPVVLAEDGATNFIARGTFGSSPSAIWSPAKREGGTKPGGLVFDAVHRSLLVRFPDAAERIAEQLGKGYDVEKVELVLPFRDTEFWPEGYADPAGMSFLGDLWVKNPPRWHAIAYALRKPWITNPTNGPTYNAYVNGTGFWAKYGAQDETKDRFPKQFGPAEVSHQQIEGRMDVTATLTEPAYGKTIVERLRAFADQGLLVRKWEIYDMHFFTGAYEWGTATGGRGILIGTPKLVVTFKPTETAQRVIKLPVPPNVMKLRGGKPTAVMPSAQETEKLAALHAVRQPSWMPDWQWRRVQELHAEGGGWTFPDTPEKYAAWIDGMLELQPRRWVGFEAAENVQEYLLYSDTWPAPVRDHRKLYWWAWLNPDKETAELVHPWNEAAKAREYVARTGDWTGNTDFYRPYSLQMGTMNFNHTAATGALIGGAIIGSKRAEADGRLGLERFPLRTWCWFDGSTQESLDHYYFAVTLKAQKIFADFGPTHMDRMMGQSILAKSVEELTSCYHPNLKRFIASSGRTGIGYLLAIQDGTQHIVHTLSHRGALTDLGKKHTVGGMPVYGHDALPGLIAQQTLNGPWAPEWAANMVDRKPLPYEMTVTYNKMWQPPASVPLWKRSYLGHHYGMASLDIPSQNETVPVMAQWRRANEPVQSAADLGTLTLRYGINSVNLLDTLHRVTLPDGRVTQNPNGSLGTFGGYPCTFQHRNKMIVLTSPLRGLDFPSYPPPKDVKSLQTAIGLMNFQSPPPWKLYVDKQPVTAFPAKVKANQRIAIHDGVSYLGIIPLPATDLGRTDEVVITDQTGPEVEMQGQGKVKPALLIEQYNFQSNTPMPDARKTSDEVDLAYAGFVIEMGDATEFKDFAAFQDHLLQIAIESRWDATGKVLHVACKIGDDTMECGFKPDYNATFRNYVAAEDCFPYRRVNGAWPYPAKGIERDSTLTQQGSTGRLEKNGALLTSEPGHMAYIQTEPVTGTYACFNPFPDPVAGWSFAVPGGVTIKADGTLSLARVIVRPKENKIWVDFATREVQAGPEMAKSLLVFGCKTVPTVILNAEPSKRRPVKRTVDGRTAFIIPLPVSVARQ